MVRAATITWSVSPADFPPFDGFDGLGGLFFGDARPEVTSPASAGAGAGAGAGAAGRRVGSACIAATGVSTDRLIGKGGAGESGAFA